MIQLHQTVRVHHKQHHISHQQTDDSPGLAGATAALDKGRHGYEDDRGVLLKDEDGAKRAAEGDAVEPEDVDEAVEER
jgi:hypothetical protein